MPPGDSKDEHFSCFHTSCQIGLTLSSNVFNVGCKAISLNAFGKLITVNFVGSVQGCTDPSACNYDSSATVDDGSCAVLDAVGECGGTCQADDDGDGVCDGDEVEGCQDVSACNYAPEATDPTPISGLSIALTSGFYASEISWTLNGETYGAPFEGFIALDGGSYTIEGFDSYGDGWNGAEMTIMDGDNVSTFSVSGSAGSIEVMVSASELACYYAPDFYECDGESCINDADGDGVCDELEILGSPVPTACNYVEGVTDLQPAVVLSLIHI